jgi:uncharacterized protein (DUF58 family)
MARPASRSSTRSRSPDGAAQPSPRAAAGARAARGLKRIGRGAAQRARVRFAAWIRRRQGADAAVVTLQRRRIYILPTGLGIAFGALLFAMLLGSMNYATSLGFALTFLLTGLALVALHECHNNLLGVEVRYVGARPVFAGEDARFQIALTNTATATRYELELRSTDAEAGPADIAPGRTVVLGLPVPTRRRGRVRLPRFSVATRHPANLCRAWTYVHMSAECIVYPRPAPPGAAAPLGSDDSAGSGAVDHADADFAGLRNAVPGDPPRRIAWKAYARTDELLLKQFAGGERRAELFDWDALAGVETEQRLSVLARWCLDAAAADRSFGLKLPSEIVPIGSGERHLHRCLTVLALYGAPDAEEADA